MTSPREPIWVREDVARAAHRRQLAEHGGADGVRDEGLLQSALGRPKNLFAYSDPPPDVFALAAAYAFGIARNHPFIDGNKRTAFVVHELFLELNGHRVAASSEGKFIAMLRLAEGSLPEADFAEWLRQHCVPAAG